VTPDTLQRGGDVGVALGQLGLVGHDDLRPRGELRRVGGELGVDDAEVVERVARGGRVEIEKVQQQPGALGVAQELVAEAAPLAGAGDEARQVRDDERALAVRRADEAERRLQRGERIVGDLGPGRRHPRHQRRLSRVGEADDADVREQLQLEAKPALGAGPSQVGASRRLVGGGREPGVAATAPGATDAEDTLARRGEIADEQPGVPLGDDGAERHAQDEIVAAGARAVATLAVLAPLGVVVALVVKVEQRGEGGIGLEEHRAAVAAVPAVGTATRDELLAAKADGAGAAVAALDEDVDLVDEHV
jgi:hypothetical protein